MQLHVRKISSAAIFKEYLETMMQAYESEKANLRNWNLLVSYAELRYRLHGGSRCAICKATVRHVVPVVAERTAGQTDNYPCLCTRCYEGERARSQRIVMQIGEARVEHRPREYGSKATPFMAAKNGSRPA